MTKNNDGQVELWAVVVGSFPTWFSMPWVKRRARTAAEFIVELDGFVGFCPTVPAGTACLFRTKNDAIRAKNMMDAVGIVTGDDIGSCLVDEEDLPERGDSGDG